MNSLPLTPFEEYMLLDSHPGYPMSCFLKLRLHGTLDTKRLDTALRNTLRLHPLLRCRVVEAKPKKFFWQENEQIPKIVRQLLDKENPFPASEGIDLLQEPAMKVVLCTEKDPDDNGFVQGISDLVFEIHHSAADAAGTQRFLEDLLIEYVGHDADSDAIRSRESVDPGQLARRGTYGLSVGRMLRLLTRQLWGFHRAWTFLLHRIMPLVPKKSDLSVTKPSPCFPALLSRQLDKTETQNVRKKAKSAGVTINDILLDATFQAMNAWQGRFLDSKTVSQKPRQYLRVAVPTNLRGPWDRLMPAANIVSMVFIDRQAKEIQNETVFLRGIHQEMQHIKRCHLGLAFIHGLTIYRSVFGSFTKMINQARCWTTATVSNLGTFFADLPLPRHEGLIQLGDALEIVAIDSAPPIRPQTALGVCALTYADRMTLDMHYDSELISRSEAETMLDLLAGYFLGEISHSPTISETNLS